MNIRLMSDLHLEFAQFKIPVLPTDDETVLILAGDVTCEHCVVRGTVPKAFVKFIESACEQFKHVVYVLGNHEFYGSDMASVRAYWQQFGPDRGIENLHVLDNRTVTLDDVEFIGATLWTDFGDNPLNALQALQDMNDFVQIFTNGIDRLTTEDWLNEHTLSVDYLTSRVSAPLAEGMRRVVVTHHAPCSMSVHPRFHKSKINSAYYSDQTDLMLDNSINLWCHGHMHNNSDYMVGECRVVANPRGYHQIRPENPSFDSKMVIEV